MEGGASGIAAVGQQSEHPKECAKNVLSLCYPRDGFNMERMECEQSGDEGARPGATGHLRQYEKQQHAVERMEYDVYEKVCACIKSKDLDGRHMGEPSQWNPIAVEDDLERPGDVFECQALLDAFAVGDIQGIVEADELVRCDTAIDGEDNRNQRETDGGMELGTRGFGLAFHARILRQACGSTRTRALSLRQGPCAGVSLESAVSAFDDRLESRLVPDGVEIQIELGFFAKRFVKEDGFEQVRERGIQVAFAGVAACDVIEGRG